mgnify:CR=1 FL=1
MSEIELPNTLLRPFGPSILSLELPQHHVDKLIALSDNNENRSNMDSRLAGQIKSEPALTIEELDESGFTDIFCAIGLQYVQNELSRNCHFEYKPEQHNIKVDLQSAWIVSQKENEYNPVHSHSNCQISAVMYLVVPEFTPRGYIGKENIDGCIEFINNTVDSSRLQSGQYLVRPKVGRLLMFPSNLLHTVYPFQGKGERRSLSFNLNYNLGEVGCL